MTMRTVTLELLRHGPAHNQLLSPLTPYLALCGNHPPETIHVGMEHLQLARYVKQLRYEQGPEVASFALHDAAREVSRLLESIRALTKELATSDPEESQRMIHLRLVLSPSELAMLPFELATAHSALLGHGQPLSLQTETPVCITREVRRVASTTFEWPDEPRILLVAAAPGGSDVPLKEHVEKLKAALQPYVEIEDPDELNDTLTVLERATLEDVRRECTRRAYTHVHILAHGALEAAGAEARHGIAFHAQHDRNKVDVVSGERLASALRSHLRDGTGEQVLSSPSVVSIASCDSANVGNVVAPGASIAHTLHEQGIPLVIGSQFPLSKAGSVVMTEVLYRRLLEGDDPRIIVHDLRQALHTAQPAAHDWASVVVYAALPSDIESQVKEARFMMARVMLDGIMQRASRITAEGTSHAAPPSTHGTSPQSTVKAADSLEKVKEQLLDAMERFEELAPDEDEDEDVDQIMALGTLASAAKQVAVVMAVREFVEPGMVNFKSGPALLKDTEYREKIEKARHYYYRCYQTGSNQAWPMVQYLALTVALQLEGTDGEKVSRKFRRLWAAASVRAEDTLEWGKPEEKAWAHASLVELALLSMYWRDPARCMREARHHIDQILEFQRMSLYENADFDARSLCRQLSRYVVFGWGTEEMRQLSSEMIQRLDPHGEMGFT